jgi:cation:H+ antiporter
MATYLLFALGFVLLIKGAQWLVDGASEIARELNISDLVIGLTVVAFGTSTPELFVNVVASARGNTGIAIGNVLGSNISNVFLILGISAVIYPLSVTKGTVWKEIPFYLLAVIVLGLLANDRILDGSMISQLTRIDGLVLLAFFSIFLYYSFSIAKEIEGMEQIVPAKKRGRALSILLVMAGFVGLGLGGRWIVNGAVSLATGLGMSESLIGLTIVAIGTSLPELATSAIAAYKKNVEIAVGNVVGSNIFNVFFVLGISSSIKPLPFQANSNFDIGMIIFSSILLFLFMFTGKRRSLDRWEGVVFVCIYCGYISWRVINEYY